MKMSVMLTNVKLGQTENHLLFEGYIPRHNYNKKYEFDFTGVEVISDSNLTNTRLERLKDKLVEDFDYAPFDEKEAKIVLGKGKKYDIDM